MQNKISAASFFSVEQTLGTGLENMDIGPSCGLGVGTHAAKLPYLPLDVMRSTSGVRLD